ncbi:fibronectin type III domain-containing protein [Geodermatophilus sp. URMC 65]
MDEPDRRARRVPGAGAVGLVAALGLLVAVLALPSVHTAFSATRGTLPSSLAADQLQPPSGLTVTQTCSYAPIALRGALASTGTSPLALSPPAGTQAGDVLVAQVAYYGTSPLTAPSGWTRVVLPDTSGGVVTSAVYWKVAAAGEPAASFARPSTESGDMVGGIVAYSGVSATAPVAASGGATGAGDTATSPAVTTTATGAVAVHLMARGGVQSATSTGSRELWTRSSDSESITAFDEPVAGSGAVPQRSSTTSGSTTAWIAQTVVLRPALQQVGASLSWAPTPSTWADGYKGERVVGGTVHGPSTVPFGTTTASDTGLANGTTYTYRVRAYRGAWVSDVVSTSLTTSC